MRHTAAAVHYQEFARALPRFNLGAVVAAALLTNNYAIANHAIFPIAVLAHGFRCSRTCSCCLKATSITAGTPTAGMLKQ
jgi:hypothetical protein